MHVPIGRLVSNWTVQDGLPLHTRCSIDTPAAAAPPVVCVHGLSVSSRYMVPTALRLAPYRRVFAPDLPGFGLSVGPPAILDIPALADALLHWMDAYGIGEATMLGNSMGCQIIAELAVRHPQRLTHAVLVGPTMDPQAPTMVQQGLRLGRDVLHEPVSSILTQARDYWAFGVRRTLGTLRAALDDHIEQKLPHMPMPTLVVRGAQDPIAPQRWVEEMVRLLPNGQLTVITGEPHATNYAAPTALVAAVLAFLGQPPLAQSAT